MRQWHDTLSRLQLPPGAWEQLRCASIRFLESPTCLAVQADGWSELDIWGALDCSDMAIVRRRGDCLGLVPALSFGRGCTIMEIQPDCVIVRRRETGSILRHRRHVTTPNAAKVWWEIDGISSKSKPGR